MLCSNHCRLRWIILLASILGFSGTACADPSGRIGRIAWLAGTVQLHNPAMQESFNAPLNQPLTSGDILSTGINSRSEIQIGSLTVRLDAESQLELSRIDDENIRLYLAAGQAIVRLNSRESLHEFDLTTRHGRFNARDTGLYRFEATANTSSGGTYYGILSFTSGDNALDIGAGHRAQFWDRASSTARPRLTTLTNDEFSAWSAARDQRSANRLYSRYVSPEMTGAEDLDAHGEWSENNEYGAIWFPRAVAADWAPYRSGHWAWIEPWGWNWVAYEPWGFAPFHYGRWVRYRGAWGWAPGVRIARPVYAPAMVAWVGSAQGSISLSIGSAPTVGWFPLAPREIYVPAYRSSPHYVRKVNITHVTHINNITTIVNNPQAAVQQTPYANRNIPQAVTVVPNNVLTHGRPVAPATLPAEAHQTSKSAVIASAPVKPPVAPSPPAAQQHTPAKPALSTPPEPRLNPAPLTGNNTTLPAKQTPATLPQMPLTTAPAAPSQPPVTITPATPSLPKTVSIPPPASSNSAPPLTQSATGSAHRPTAPVQTAPAPATNQPPPGRANATQAAVSAQPASASQTPPRSVQGVERPSTRPEADMQPPSRTSTPTVLQTTPPIPAPRPPTQSPSAITAPPAGLRNERAIPDPPRPQPQAQMQREEAPGRPAPREMRSEAATPQARPNTPARIEAPQAMPREVRHEPVRDTVRPAEPRTDHRAPRNEERQHQGPNEKRASPQRRDDAEKR